MDKCVAEEARKNCGKERILFNKSVAAMEQHVFNFFVVVAGCVFALFAAGVVLLVAWGVVKSGYDFISPQIESGIHYIKTSHVRKETEKAISMLVETYQDGCTHPEAKVTYEILQEDSARMFVQFIVRDTDANGVWQKAIEKCTVYKDEERRKRRNFASMEDFQNASPPVSEGEIIFIAGERRRVGPPPVVPVFNSEKEARAAGHKNGDTIRIIGLGIGTLTGD